jgi:hypothetical protein
LGTDAIALFVSLFNVRIVVHTAVSDPGPDDGYTVPMVYDGQRFVYEAGMGDAPVATLHFALVDGLHWRVILTEEMVSTRFRPCVP